MSYWACEFDVSHLISPYPRINKFHPAFFTKFRVLFFSSDHSIISTSTNTTFCGARDSFTKQSIFFRFVGFIMKSIGFCHLSNYLPIGQDFVGPSPYLLRRHWSNSELLMFMLVDHRIEILIYSDQTAFLLIWKFFSDTRKCFNSRAKDRSSRTSNRKDSGASSGVGTVPPMIVAPSNS